LTKFDTLHPTVHIQGGTDYFAVNPSASYNGYQPPFAIGNAPREQMASSGVKYEPHAPCEYDDMFSNSIHCV
jgi:hypothetical protein